MRPPEGLKDMIDRLRSTRNPASTVTVAELCQALESVADAELRQALESVADYLDGLSDDPGEVESNG